MTPLRTHLNRRRIVLTAAGALAPLLSFVALAFSCGPAGHVELNPSSGLPGAKVMLTGHGFPEVPITITGPNDVVLGTANGPAFTRELTVPDVKPDVYTIVAQGTWGDDVVVKAAVALTVLAPPPPPPPPPPAPPPAPPPQAPSLPLPTPLPEFSWLPAPALVASEPVGPRLVRPAGNETISVSRHGTFTLFCGRFLASGVGGTCGAASTAAAARRLPMRATVIACDALGHQSTRTFSFALKAPAKRQ